MNEKRRLELLELARKSITGPATRIEHDAQVSAGREPGQYFVEAWVLVKTTPDFEVGQDVTYTHYGVEEVSTIVSISRDGEILFMANGRWKHVDSCTPVLKLGEVA